MITTDPTRLRQILFNIIGNAIKFTKQGSVDVKIKLHKHADSRQLVFSVRDTGPGISPQQISRLFTPFTQADSSTTRRFGGTGLGLVLSKKLARALGGDVELTRSEPGVGSLFTISIDPGRVVMPKESLILGSAQKPLVPSQVSLNDLRVLLVDDSLDNQVLVGRFLKMAKADVKTASNGREAVEKALQEDFDVVLMDLQMPEMDGYQALEHLKMAGYSKPIIALTAHAMHEERQRCLESGFAEHLSKPVDRQALLEAISFHTTSMTV
jgi:CheY-like chemotaxis protein/anti-sigma regulatory factor (Ser/Thr protein kinase)